MKTKPFAMIGVNVMGHSPKALKVVMEKEQINWRTFAGGNEIWKRWNSPATPTFYIIGPNGVILRKWVGHPGEKTLESVLEKSIGEAERAG